MDIPQLPIRHALVMGAGGRIGGILRACWAEGFARWQIRQTILQPDWVTVATPHDPETLAHVAARSRVILCLAGVTSQDRGEMGDNVTLGLAAVRAGAASGARVILCSSAAVYGRTPGLLSETTPPAPDNAYGHAKAEMEAQATRLAAELGVHLSCLRIGNVAGADAALGGWTPECRMDRFPDGATPARSYIGPRTLARVLHALCLRDRLPGVLNVAAPGLVQMGELLDAAGRAWCPCPASGTALREIALDVARLCDLVPLAPAAPGALVDEWRVLAGQAA